MKLILISCMLLAMFLPNIAWGMYGEDTAPSEDHSQYMTDKEDTNSITIPEEETVMPEASQDIRQEEKSNPDEDYIEDNVTHEIGFNDNNPDE